MKKEVKDLIELGVSDGISYGEYRSLVQGLVAEGKSTGEHQSEDLANYTVLNDKRMKRFDKTVKIDETTSDSVARITKKQTWLVFTESWCGDAAPSLPVLNKLAELNSNIDFKVILRDTHLDLLEHFMYNNTLSIPRLLIIDDNKEVAAKWGPRPTELQKLVEIEKAEQGALSAEFKQELQVWYNKDKGKSVIEDVTTIVDELVK